jgi:hypothetical protein
LLLALIGGEGHRAPCLADSVSKPRGNPKGTGEREVRAERVRS